MKKIRRAWFCPKCKVINEVKTDGTDPIPCACPRYAEYHNRALEIRKIQKAWVPLLEIREE